MATRASSSGTTCYSWDTSSDLPELATEGSRPYTYGVGPMGFATSSGTYTYRTDPLGSVVELSDSSGNSIESYRYSPYGEADSADGSSEAVSALGNSLRYAGQYLDSESDLYDMRAREYDPGVGRFLEVDPLETAAGDPSVGAYVYVDDRPTTETDPSGEWLQLSWLGPLLKKLAQAAEQQALAKRLRTISVDGYKIVYPRLTVSAAVQAHMPLSLACAFLSQESDGGRNEWGHDKSIFNGGYDAAHRKNWGPIVTEAAYLAYKRERGPKGAGGMQGVGPMQLTYYSYQNDADTLGGAWKPLPNMIVGFRVAMSNIARNGLSAGIAAYNGSGPPARAYAHSVLGLERKWAVKLGLKSVQ